MSININSAKFLRYISFLLLLPFCLYCNEEKIQPRNFPRVRTLSIDQPDATGVNVTGEIFSTEGKEVEDYGFFWDRKESTGFEEGNKVSLGATSSALTFSGKVDFAIPRGNRIYVKAYARSGEYTSFGNSFLFISKGGKLPIIEDFSPKEGLPLDTIRISGANFTQDHLTMKVQFGDQASSWIPESDTSIKVLVPENLPQEAVHIFLEYDGAAIESEETFTQIVPSLNEISPTRGTFGDVIEIKGRNFHRFPLRNEVFFDSTKAKIIGGTQELLRVEVPTELHRSTLKISVQIENVRETAVQNFTLIPPQITSFSPQEGLIGEPIILSGNYFNPMISGNSVKIGENTLEVVSASKTQLEAKVIDDFFPKRSQKLSVEIAEQIAESPMEYTIKDYWVRVGKIRSADSLNGRISSLGFTINGTGYMGLGSGNINREIQDLYTYVPSTRGWSQLASFPGTGINDAKSFVIGDEAYVLGGRDRPGRQVLDVFAYVASENRWRAITAFPGNSIQHCFAVGNKGYVIEGWRSNAPDLWEYTPQTDTWAAISTTPFNDRDLGVLSALTLNGKAYVLTIINAQTPNSLWEFDPATMTWVQKASLPTYIAPTTCFSLNGSIYLFNPGRSSNSSTSFFQYDPNLDTWTDISHYQAPNVSSSSSFSVGNKGYLMGGTLRLRDVPYTNQMWEFDPNP